jgi:hypothetical protein
MSRRAEGLAAVEGLCPRCGARRERRQEYCVECGLRLPSLQGAVPALRRRWLRGFAWYPGDWIWVSLLMALVAAAGGAVAIAFGAGPSSETSTTSVAPAPHPAPTTTAPLPEANPSGQTSSRSGSKARNGRAGWPAGRRGWTIVLFSYPSTTGTTAAYSTAARAARQGLTEVGVLDSGRFASLHPGYYVVFSGVYSTAAEAEAALRSVRAAGFSSAYTRQISR